MYGILVIGHDNTPIVETYKKAEGLKSFAGTNGNLKK